MSPQNHPINYVIVGADVDEAEHFLHPDGTISDRPDPGAEALDVEFIGRLMVRLSEAGPGATDPDTLARHQEHIRLALRVRDMPGPDGRELSEAQKAAILDTTKVQIVFETREAGGGGTDANARVLVVPSDRTLEIRQRQLDGADPGPGFPPPLTYDLDRALMLASLADELREIVAGFAAQHPPGWTAELQAALMAYLDQQIAARTTFRDPTGAPSDDARNAILQSPVRAFHRSVGIYATNMCR
jgi:hypothetical protein